MRRLLVTAALAGCGHPANGVDGSLGDDGNAGDGVILPGDGPTAMDAVITPSCPSGQWCVEPAPAGVTGTLASVWAVNSNNVFAVGDGGTILYRHQNAWAAMTSNTSATLRAVWAANAADVYAGGENGALVHYDGSAWTPITGVTSASINAIWGSASNDVWIVGTSLAKHWNGSAWSTPTMVVPAGTLLAVSGTGPTDVWATGENAKVRHYTGQTTSWDTLTPIGGENYYYAIAVVGTSVWVTATDAGKETDVYGGSTWTPYGSTTVFQALYAPSAGEVWAAGSTMVGHWTGSSWTVENPTGVTATLTAITGAASDVFVVGAGAMILHRD